MVKICALPHGWSLWADTDNGQPRFKTPEGAYRTPYEVASKSCAFDIFVAVSWYFEILSREWRRTGQDLKWSATSKAKIGLELALKLLERFDEEKWKYMKSLSVKEAG